MDELKNIIAKNIQNLRTKNSLTQLGLAQLLSYSDKAVSKWERAESVPDVYVLKKMAEIFGVSVDYLISDHETDKTPDMPSRASSKRFWIAMLSAIAVIALATLVFVLLWIFYKPVWQVFIYAFPIVMLLMLVYSSVWGGRSMNFWWIMGLVQGIILSVYISFVSFSPYNPWQILILSIPAALIVITVFSRRLFGK